MTDALDFLFGLMLTLSDFGWLWLLALPAYLTIVLFVWSWCVMAKSNDQTQRRREEGCHQANPPSSNGSDKHSSVHPRSLAPLGVFAPDWTDTMPYSAPFVSSRERSRRRRGHG